jgi:hypothetical protein
VKKAVLPHGASSKEKAILTWGLWGILAFSLNKGGHENWQNM